MCQKTKKAIRNLVEVLTLRMVRIAKGSASSNYSYQPKEPPNLDFMLKNLD